jgi:hypothetical protein
MNTMMTQIKEYKVLYLHEDGSMRYKYIDALNAEYARSLVYGMLCTEGCVQTLSAELVSN